MKTQVPDFMVPAFAPFHLRVLPRERVAERLRGPVGEVALPGHVDGVLDTVWQGLADTVEEQAYRTLIGAFHSFREAEGLPMSTESDTALRRFTAHLDRDGTAGALLDAHPVLRERLETILANSLNAHTDLFTSYARDLPVLRENGLVSAEGRVTDVFATGSDPHNDNRQVFGLRLADGGRIVFKPRPLVADDFVRDLYRVAEPHLRHSLLGCVPRSVTVGDHGWQSFVAPEPMETADQPPRYYYRFGALCALFGSIGAGDLHDENVLAHGETPCVLDTETMVRPDPDAGADGLTTTLGNQLKLSVVSTMLVPNRHPGSRIDVLMAGVGVQGEQASSQLERPAIVHQRSDAVQVRWEKVTYRHKDNLPRLGDQTLGSTDHYGDIIEGYLDALGAVRGDGLRAVLDDYPDLPVRVLVRSTMVYSRFADAATHPRYLVRPEEAERVLGLLGHYPKHLPREGADYIRGEELRALATGNIPYFMTRGASRELATPESSFPDAYATSPLDYAREGLRLNAERSDLYHRFVMEECFSEVLGEDSPAGLWEHSVFRQTGPAPVPGSWWEGIAERIHRIGVTFEGGDGPETGWLCGAGPDRDAFTVNPGHLVSFHDLGGTVAFLQRAARGDERWRPVHGSADRGLDSLLATYGAPLVQVPESVFTGDASLLMTRPDRLDEDWLTGLVDRIDARAAAGAADTDLVSSPAGVLMTLLAKPEGTVPVPLLLRLRDLAVPHVGLERDRPWFDLAHGELGLRWAAARAGGALGDRELVRKSADWVRARVEEGEHSPSRGWCNGTAGLLLAAAEIAATADRGEWLSGRLLSGLVDRATDLGEGPVDLSVCHGTSGVVQSLLAAARSLDAPALVDRAREYQEAVIARIRREGFYTGAAGRTSLLGYMLGWSGVGDTDLLLGTYDEDSRIPAALTL